MKLESLHIERAPGLPSGLSALEFQPGLTVVLGPNASGKSTLTRLVHALLWPHDAQLSATTRVTSRWNLDGQILTGDIVARQVSWLPKAPGGILPGAASLARFDLRSLLATKDVGDQQLAARILRELAGGLDLAAAAQSFGTSPTLSSHRNLKTDLSGARSGLDEANQRAAGLFEQERQRAGLDARIHAAELARRELDAAKKLRELVVAKESLGKLEAQVGSFEPGVDELLGNEGERIDELTRELDARRLQLEHTEAERKSLEQLRQTLAFPNAAPKRPDLHAWSARLDQLAETSKRIETYHEDLADAEQTCETARALLVEESHAEGVTHATLEQLTESLRAFQAAQAAVYAKRETAQLWDGWAAGETEDPEALSAAIRAQRVYLRLPDVARSATSPAWVPLALLALGALAFLIGLGAWLQEPPSRLAAGALFVLGICVLVVGLRMRRAKSGVAGTDPRALARAELERTGQAPPGWSPGELEAHLDDLEKRRAKLEQARRAADQAQTAHQAVESAAAEAAQLEAELLDLATSAGITHEFLGLGLAQEVHALFHWREAERRAMGLRAKLAEAERALETKLLANATWMATFDYAAPRDVPDARARLRALEERCGDLDKNGVELKSTRQNHDALAKSIAQHEKDLAKNWARTRVSVGDLARLAQRMEAHAAWSELQEPLRDALVAHEVASKNYTRGEPLRHLEDRAADSVTRAEVDGWIEELEAHSDQYGTLREERGAIDSELRGATEGHDLGDALAKLGALEEEVAATRHAAAEDALARWLLDEAGGRQQAGSGSKWISAVQARFGSFTQHGWMLELDAQGTFCARDTTTEELRSLEQLSDGTRIQLLLAARLTALQELEASGPVPICLDEALSTSDPVRFRVIAGALFDEADAGRQILYFTADPNEAEQWRQAAIDLERTVPEVLDLGRLAGKGADWGRDLVALPPQPDPLPDPEGKTPEEYARALGVPRPDGFLGAPSWHLYLVAHDDLGPLVTCLHQRITTLGQWRAVRAAHALPAGFPSDVALRFDARANLCETLAELWLEGRGRPVTWEDVAASGAVSDTYAERVRDELLEHAEDPRHFVTAVRGLRGFRGNKADELETHLESVGCLPLDEPLANDELVRRALGGAGSLETLGGTQRAAAYCDWLLALLEA